MPTGGASSVLRRTLRPFEGVFLTQSGSGSQRQMQGRFLHRFLCVFSASPRLCVKVCGLSNDV